MSKERLNQEVVFTDDGVHLPTITDFENVVSWNKDGTPRSYVTDLKWDYIGTTKVRVTDRLDTGVVSFESIPCRYRESIQKPLALLSRKRIWSIAHIKTMLREFTLIAKLLGSSNWRLLDGEFHYNRFCSNLKNEELGEKRCENIASLINALCAENYTRRYVNTADFVKDNAREKTENGQSIAIPESYAMRIFQYCINIIEKYHPHRHDISRMQEEYYSWHCSFELSATSRRTHGKKFREKLKAKYGVDFNPCSEAVEITDIQIACSIITYGFSGIRLKEGQSIDSNSYGTIDYEDVSVPLLKGYTTKKNKGGTPKQTVWPTHFICEKALSLAHDMSEYARKSHKEWAAKLKDEDRQNLALKQCDLTFIRLYLLQGNTILPSSLSAKMFSFLKKSGIVATEQDVREFDLANPELEGKLIVGKCLPKFSSHDLRRTFAVFMARNNLGNLFNLKYQFKHDNSIMTLYYQNHSELLRHLDYELDAELVDEIENTKKHVLTETLYEIYNESTTLSGKEGERILDERKKYAGSIYMTRSEIRRKLDSGEISLVEHPTGYCTKPNCDRICASDSSTVTCQHEIVSPEKAKSRIPVRERLIRRFRAMNTGEYFNASILYAMKVEIKAIEITLAKHAVEVELFDDEIVSNSIISDS
ncbi:hypothetical protein [Vibrio parahaemolyticus]|uniref:hypothetical protein n=1 Tax=Vibrio parahaemolyticus TaxID=670 RepID=UPI00226B0685|nr:hypothetical protein [Vibrio parahaemolyticus]MCX8858916.1 hypothetical protein [Vibrio parahaemolyticus]MCX8899782.1 hypothetical protein [Vibrio parahaemolyticus]MCX8919807.1 hypothetical protein [Vibrio parahaemolyticus]